MTDQNAATPAVDPNAPVVTPQVVYLKDCSFESPHGPFVGGLEGQPAVNLNISTRATALAQDLHEVVVQVHLEAKAGDKVKAATAKGEGAAKTGADKAKAKTKKGSAKGAAKAKAVTEKVAK